MLSTFNGLGSEDALGFISARRSLLHHEKQQIGGGAVDGELAGLSGEMGRDLAKFLSSPIRSVKHQLGDLFRRGSDLAALFLYLHSSMDVSCFANELSTFICINNGYLKRKEKYQTGTEFLQQPGTEHYTLAEYKVYDAGRQTLNSLALMPFLYARMFSSIAKFSSVINQGNIQQFLYAAVKAIGMDVYITR
nr:importin-9 isoform X2 [Ipomoea batatas]